MYLFINLFLSVYIFRFLEMNRLDLTGLPDHDLSISPISAQHTLKKWRPDVVFFIYDLVIKALDLNSDIYDMLDLFEYIRKRSKLKRLVPKIYHTYNHMKSLIHWDTITEPMKTTVYMQIAELNYVINDLMDFHDEFIYWWSDDLNDEAVTGVIEDRLSAVHKILIR